MLTVDGIVFIDGNLDFGGLHTNPMALYSGNGTIYANGTVVFEHSGTICGPGAGATQASCDAQTEHWDPTQGQLLLWALNSSNLATAVSLVGSAFYEGGAVADSQSAVYGQFKVANGAVLRGPAIGDYGSLDGDGKVKAFAFTPPGSPGSGFTLGPAYNYGGG